MKSGWKRRNEKNHSKKQKYIAERTDVLQALEEQRKHQQEQETKENESIKEIPGFFYDGEKKKYFPLSMRKDIGCVAI